MNTTFVESLSEIAAQASRMQNGSAQSERTWRYTAQVDDATQGEKLRDAVEKSLPQLRHLSTTRLCESLENHKVVFVDSPNPSFTERTQTMLAFDAAVRELGAYNVRTEQDRYANEPGVVALPKHLSRARRRFKTRVEFLHDAVVLRSMLSAWVQAWTESGYQYTESSGQLASLDGLDRDIEFEVTDEAPSLDVMRWLISNANDFHVCAESLNYSDAYTGERLDYELVERMSPDSATLQKLIVAQKGTLRWLGCEQPDIVALVKSLEEELADRST